MTDWTKKIIIVLFGTIHSSHWRSAWNGRAPTRSRSKKHILELTSQVQLERSRRSVACAHSLSICAKGRRLAINNKKPLHPIRDVLPCQFFDRVLFFILISWNIWFEPDVSPPGLCERSFFFLIISSLLLLFCHYEGAFEWQPWTFLSSNQHSFIRADDHLIYLYISTRIFRKHWSALQPICWVRQPRFRK